MRKFKNNLRAELVDSYRRGWQRSIHRCEEQPISHVVINCSDCQPSASGALTAAATVAVRHRYHTED